ncbi:MAG: LysR family transcriptional regulator [Spirochaetales bacterium]|nr:LysR family transcriptional regulator [Spirochaetales bacterium]
MNVRDYEYIVEIATLGSLSRAADKLCITPGALSKYLTRLEEMLEIKLFKRNGNRFILTKAGSRYVELGKAILLLDEQVDNDIREMKDSGESAFRFGATKGMSSFVLKRMLPEFYLNNDVQIAFERGSSEELIKGLEEGRIDLCFTYVTEKKSDLDYIFLAHVPLVLALPSSSPLIDKAKRKDNLIYPCLSDLSWLDENYISLTRMTLSGQIAESYLSSLDRRPNVRLYAPDTISALDAVEGGIGNTLMLALPYTDRSVRFLSLPNTYHLGADVYAVFRRGDDFGPTFDHLLSLGQRYYKNIDILSK